MAAGVSEFVQGSPMPMDGLEIGFGRRHLNEIERQIIKGAIAANAKIGAGGSDHGFGLGQDQSLGNRCGSACQFRREIFALVGVEHCKSLQEADRVGLASVALGASAFLIWREAVGVDYGRAPLTLADVSAKAERLAEGKPALACESALDDDIPKDQYVDAGIAALGCRVLRHVERRLRRRRPPGLNPRNTASLQLGDDLVGDFLIKARPVPTDASVS